MHPVLFEAVLRGPPSALTVVVDSTPVEPLKGVHVFVGRNDGRVETVRDERCDHVVRFREREMIPRDA